LFEVFNVNKDESLDTEDLQKVHTTFDQEKYQVGFVNKIKT